MPTQVQIEAQRLLAEEEKRMAALRKIRSVGTKVADTLVPGIGQAMRIVAAAADAVTGAGGGFYQDELRKAANGERSDLPSEPDGDFCCFG